MILTIVTAIVGLAALVYVFCAWPMEVLMYTQWKNLHGAHYTVIDEDDDSVTLLTGVGTTVITKENLRNNFTRTVDVGE